MGHIPESELINRLDLANKKVEVGVRYRHSKSGSEVTVLHIGLTEDNEEPAVIYRHEDGAKIIWVRSVDEFTEEVEIDGKKVPRFTKIGHL